MEQMMRCQNRDCTEKPISEYRILEDGYVATFCVQCEQAIALQIEANKKKPKEKRAKRIKKVKPRRVSIHELLSRKNSIDYTEGDDYWNGEKWVKGLAK